MCSKCGEIPPCEQKIRSDTVYRSLRDRMDGDREKNEGRRGGKEEIRRKKKLEDKKKKKVVKTLC